MPTPTPSLPSPRTWSPADLVTVPRLRADVANAVAFLAQKPLFIGQGNASASVPNNTDQPLAMQVELVDNWNGHLTVASGGAAPSQYWAPVPGWYLCRNAVSYTTGAGAYPIAAGFAAQVNGASYGPVRGGLAISGASTNYIAQCLDLIQQVNSGAPGGSGDWIQPLAWQDSGGALPLNGSAAALPTASVRWACALSGTQPLPVPPLTTVPSPITSAWLNANVRDAVRFLAYPPACKAHYVAGSSSMPSNTLGTAAVVPCNTVDLDNYGGWSTSANTYTAPVSGVYLLYGQFNLTSSAASGVYAAGLSVNGGTTQWGDIVTFAPSPGSAGGATVCRRIRLTAGQTVQLLGAQGSGGTLAYATAAVSQTRFIALWDGI
jgi:hypothetical protein